MTIDRSFNRPEIRRIAGPCIRPGGPVLTEKALPDRSICGRIVADFYGKCMDILVSHGFDPAVGKNG